MSRIGNCWLSMSQTLINDYKERRAIEDEGGEYTGRIDDTSWEIMTRITADATAIERQYKPVQVQGETYKCFSVWSDDKSLKNSIDFLYDTWGNEARPLGSWWNDTGIQGGQQPVYDDDGNLIDISGTPIYPIPNNCYLFMPDIVTYDEDGNEIGRELAQSNDDLRDVNLLLGQVPRIFTETLP